MIEANRRVSVLVGALVVVVGVALAGILIFLGTSTRLFARTVKVSACFSDVTGLRSGASVVVAGVTVGSVARVTLGEVCPGRARVELALDAGAVSHVSADARAKLATMGLLGDRLVVLVSGPAGERLQAGAVLEGEVPPDASAVIAQAGEAFDVLTRIARRFDETLASTDLKAVLDNLSATARSLRRVVARAEHGPGLLHLLIYDRALQQQVRAVGPAAGDAEKAIRQLDKAAADVAQIVAYVKSGQGTIGGLIYDPAIYEDLRTIVGRVRRSFILRTLARFILKHR
jgi:phospholipid/cholesterol/gamma-HCH transport system substrate-binding protein